MTATVPPRVRLGTRLGVVYAYQILDPATGQVRTDYVGQTIQTLAARDRQHRGRAPNRDGTTTEQPWADLIVGQPHVIEQGMWTAAQLDARERWQIATLRPRYNVQHNWSNPDRIRPWEAQEARRRRDPSWGAGPALPRTAPARPVLSLWSRLRATRLGRRTSAWLETAATVAAFWAGLVTVGTVALWLGCGLDPETAGGATAAGVTFGMAKWWPRKRRRRR